MLGISAHALELVVALRKESVDRNNEKALLRTDSKTSLSARRAWIEIPTYQEPCRKTASLSARRAWIEINVPLAVTLPEAVALRKESVDRNTDCALLCLSPPQSLSARRAWIEISVIASALNQR